MFTPANHKYGALFLDFFDAVGDGTGSINMNVDGSVTPQEFKLTCPAGYSIQLEALSVFIQDNGGFTANGYGALLQLTNGIRLEIRGPANEVLSNVTDQLPIKSNANWIAYAFKIDSFNFSAGENILSLSYNLSTGGRPLYLGPGMSYVLIVNDDLTGLSDQFMQASYVRTKL